MIDAEADVRHWKMGEEAQLVTKESIISMIVSGLEEAGLPTEAPHMRWPHDCKMVPHPSEDGVCLIVWSYKNEALDKAPVAVMVLIIKHNIALNRYILDLRPWMCREEDLPLTDWQNWQYPDQETWVNSYGHLLMATLRRGDKFVQATGGPSNSSRGCRAFIFDVHGKQFIVKDDDHRLPRGTVSCFWDGNTYACSPKRAGRDTSSEAAFSAVGMGRESSTIWQVISAETESGGVFMVQSVHSGAAPEPREWQLLTANNQGLRALPCYPRPEAQWHHGDHDYLVVTGGDMYQAWSLRTDLPTRVADAACDGTPSPSWKSVVLGNGG